METVRINNDVFSSVMSMTIEKKGGGLCGMIELPRDVSKLYLRSLEDPIEIELLKKHEENIVFSDQDYENLFKLFINNVSRLDPCSKDVSKFLESFGVEILGGDKGIEFKIIAEYLPQIRVDTWESIAISLLSDAYTDIINCFDFGNINIDLRAWVSVGDEEKQSLLSAFRSAFIFTIINYLYGDDKNLYLTFNDYFENEFYKRIAFISNVWSHHDVGSTIKYIPIFESFYNLDGLSSSELIKIIKNILDDDNIVADERNMVYNRLIDGTNEFRTIQDAQQKALEDALIKPVVNFLVEMKAAKSEMEAAIKLCEEKLYNQAIGRCYYSMMHSVKALLEKNQKLSDWVPDKLSVNTSHSELDKKFKKLSTKGIVGNPYYLDFRYVKQKRWTADYAVFNFDKAESKECIRRTTIFLEEIEKITC